MREERKRREAEEGSDEQQQEQQRLKYEQPGELVTLPSGAGTDGGCRQMAQIQLHMCVWQGQPARPQLFTMAITLAQVEPHSKGHGRNRSEAITTATPAC